MKLRNIIALLLVLCMAFALVACGAETESKKSDDNEEIIETEEGEKGKSTEDEEEVKTDDTKPQVGEYIVCVKDEDGNPVAGVELEFAKDTGDTTIKTDENGRARLTCLVTDITVTVEEVPEGFEMDDEEYEFDDEFEITITLKAE